MRKLQLLAICAVAFASVTAFAQSNNLPNLSSDVGATVTTNADSITGNENLVLSGGGAGVPVKPFFIGNNDNAAGTNPLCAALRGAHLARAGAMLALALGAAQAGATTYTVPLQFNLALAAPVCSLTVGGQTADADTNAPTLAPVNIVPITDTALAVIQTPVAIVNAIPNTTDITANGPGLTNSGGVPPARKLLGNTPTAFVTCTLGTPMTARLSKASVATNSSPGPNYMAGSPGSGQNVGIPNTLPIGMFMGIAKFADIYGATDDVTGNSTQPFVTATASGGQQNLILNAAIYASSTVPLGTTYAGNWTYTFNVNLDF